MDVIVTAGHQGCYTLQLPLNCLNIYFTEYIYNIC